MHLGKSNNIIRRLWCFLTKSSNISFKLLCTFKGIAPYLFKKDSFNKHEAIYFFDIRKIKGKSSEH